MSAMTPIVSGARFLLEPRLSPGPDPARLYVVVWEDGQGGRVEVCAGPDADRMEWLAGSAATFHGVDLVDRRDDVPPAPDHMCAWCPAEVRDLLAYAHNTVGAQAAAYDGTGDWTRARRKVDELAGALERNAPALAAHFAATTTSTPPAASPAPA